MSGSLFDLTNRRKAWEKARAAIGRDDITWHASGTELGRGSASDKLVGKALGHSPNSTATRRYRHVMNDEVQEALDAMPDIGLPMMIEEMSDEPHARTTHFIMRSQKSQ